MNKKFEMNRQERMFAFILMLYMQYKFQKFPPLPYYPEDEFTFLMLLNTYMTYLRNIRIPLPFYNFTLRNRILENENADQLVTRDFFAVLSTRPYEFWIISGETLQSFNNLLLQISPRTLGFRYGSSLSLQNRLLMTLMWLRQYPTYTVLSLTFGVNVPTVCSVLNTMWVILWEECAQLVAWPDVNIWRQKIGTWPEMTNVLGCIDGTSHEILVPSTEPQEEFYSGHRKYHCIHTQIIIDNQKNICHVHSGFLGHDNDAFAYHQMKAIGPGMELDFPANCFILGDSIYPNRRPLVTPYKSQEIVRQPRQERRRRRRFNILHRRRRVYVEHVIKELKTFKIIGSLYRHPRWELSCIVELCAGLAKRRADLISNVYS